jgi:hypothetical protein
MKRSLGTALAAVLLLTFTASMGHAQNRQDEPIEKAGVAVGVSAGNLWFLPIKLITVTVGAVAGALSYVVTGGNAELTQQIWRDTQDQPYIIDQKLARTGVGYRPELEARK